MTTNLSITVTAACASIPSILGVIASYCIVVQKDKHEHDSTYVMIEKVKNKIKSNYVINMCN